MKQILKKLFSCPTTLHLLSVAPVELVMEHLMLPRPEANSSWLPSAHYSPLMHTWDVLRSRGSSSDYISRCGISLNSNSRAPWNTVLSFGKTVSLMSKHLLQGDPAFVAIFAQHPMPTWKDDFYLPNLQAVRWEPKMYAFPMHPSKTRDSLNDQSGNKMSGKSIFSFKSAQQLS